MLDGKKQAEFDQASAALTEMLPSMWRRLYLKLIDEGFIQSEAFELLKTYVTASCGGGQR